MSKTLDAPSLDAASLFIRPQVVSPTLLATWKNAPYALKASGTNPTPASPAAWMYWIVRRESASKKPPPPARIASVPTARVRCASSHCSTVNSASSPRKGTASAKDRSLTGGNTRMSQCPPRQFLVISFSYRHFPYTMATHPVKWQFLVISIPYLHILCTIVTQPVKRQCLVISIPYLHFPYTFAT